MGKNKKTKLDEYHYHEAVDRAYCVVDMASIVSEHPVYKKEKEFRKKWDEGIAKLYDAYQIVGGIRHEKFKDS